MYKLYVSVKKNEGSKLDGQSQKHQEIIENYSQGLLTKASIEKIAKDENITPALIARTAKVVQSVKEFS